MSVAYDAHGEDWVYKTALFGENYNSEGINSYYTKNWYSTNDGFTVNLKYFNNYNNGWNYVKGGGRGGEGVITTGSAIDRSITKVVVTVDNVTTTAIENTFLIVASDSKFTQNVHTIQKAASQGDITYTISNPTRNMYYKFTYVCKKGAENGLITISKIDFYTDEENQNEPDDTSLKVNIVAEEGYSTFCSNNAFIMPEDLKGATAEFNNGVMTWNWCYNSGDVVPARTPILLYGTPGEHVIYKTTSEKEKPSNNYLYCNTNSSTKAASSIATSCTTFYALGYGLGENVNTLGFYWLTENGESFDVPAGKVFLALPSGAEAKERIMFDKSDDDDATFIDNVTPATKYKGEMYNLNGHRVNSTHKGIIIKDGKKWLNK